MPAVLVDTDVVSYLHKKDNRARLYRSHLAGKEWAISFMTLAELERWALARGWGESARAGLERHLQRFEVYYADRDLCRLWAEVMDRARRKGQPLDIADAWIASTALALNCPLVTHNAADFQGISGLAVVSASGQ